jgi:pilus assembly protein Flp/PilA
VSVASVFRRVLWTRACAEEGQALLEYALVLALVALVSVGVLTALGTNVSGTLGQVSSNMDRVLNS